MCHLKFLCKNSCHLFSILVWIILWEEESRFALVTYDTSRFLQEISTFHSDSHVWNYGINLLIIFLSKVENLLQDRCFHIDFDYNTVGILYDFITVLFKDFANSCEIRSLWDRSHNFTVIIKDSEPCSETIFSTTNVLCIYFMSIELVNYIIRNASIINYTDICRLKFNISNILNYITANTTMYLKHTTYISSTRNILCSRISFDINKYCSNNNNTHSKSPHIHNSCKFKNRPKWTFKVTFSSLLCITALRNIFLKKIQN